MKVFSLPIEHGQSVEFKCDRKYVNMGDKIATCGDGSLQPEPSCRETSKKIKDFSFHILTSGNDQKTIIMFV